MLMLVSLLEQNLLGAWMARIDQDETEEQSIDGYSSDRVEELSILGSLFMTGQYKYG